MLKLHPEFDFVGSFTLANGEAVVTDPGYSMKEIGIPGLGLSINVSAGEWIAHQRLVMSKDIFSEYPEEIIAFHSSVRSVNKIRWRPEMDEIGGDHGLIAIVGGAVFSDRAKRESMYGTIQESCPAGFEGFVVPNALVVHWDLSVCVSIGEVGRDLAAIKLRIPYTSRN